MIGGSTSGRWVNAFETQVDQIKFINEDIDHPNRVVLGNVIVQALWQQRTFDFGVHLE